MRMKRVNESTKIRLVCEVSERFRKDIKRRAEKSGVTVKSYIINALINRMKEEDESSDIHHNHVT